MRYIPKIDWGKLSDMEFEELCYDILEKSGFINLMWIGRKGKDRGRDIIAEKHRKELHRLRTEKWLVQCKKYLSKPPSPSSLGNDLAWADYHNPDVFLIMLTNTLTPDTHDWIEGVKKTRKYDVQVCDEKQLRSLLEDFDDLTQKYGLLPYNETIKAYLDGIKWAFSKVKLDGMGEFRDKQDTDLLEVFIDVKIRLSMRWRPEKFDSWKIGNPKEKLIPVVRELVENSLPVTKILESDELKHIVLLGNVGSGKSTIGQYLCLSVASAEGSVSHSVKIPFLVILRDYCSRKKRRKRYHIVDYLKDEVRSRLRRCPKGFVEYCLTNLDSIVVYDGYDEVMNEKDRKIVRDEIQTFVNSFGRSRHLVTSRMVGYEDAPLDINLFLHIELQPLESFQIDKFVQDWYSRRERDPKTIKKNTTSLLRAIRKNPALRQLAQNPLLLTMIALVHKAEADLPRQRALLYERCTEAFLVNRDRARDLVSYNEYEIRSCHEYLGFWMHIEEMEQIGVDELRKILAESLSRSRSMPKASLERKIDEFIQTAKRRVGLIVERAGVFAFGHRSFKEYFAARYLASNAYGIDDLWEVIGNYILFPHWHEVILLLAGRLAMSCKRGSHMLIEKILNTEPKALTSVLASDIANDRTPIDETLHRRIADELIKSILEDPDASRIQVCALSLYKLQNSGIKRYILSKCKKTFSEFPNSQRIYSVYILARGETRDFLRQFL